MGAEVTQRNVLDMQVCVPVGWTGSQVIEFAENSNPCGTMNGWFIRCEGDERLKGMPERNPCAAHQGFVHIMLDA